MDSGIQLFSPLVKLQVEKNMKKKEKNGMFYLEKTIEISASHKLELDYGSKCQRLHGHNFKVKIYCKSPTLGRNGMVVDFEIIKELVSALDHSDLNHFILQPTSENIAKYVWKLVPRCYKVDVIESEGNKVTYEGE